VFFCRKRRFEKKTKSAGGQPAGSFDIPAALKRVQ
jgi:hypothetical protein